MTRQLKFGNAFNVFEHDLPLKILDYDNNFIF